MTKEDFKKLELEITNLREQVALAEKQLNEERAKNKALQQANEV